MSKEKKSKLKKNLLRVGTGVLAFMAGLAATFFLVPSRVRDIVFDEPQIEEQTENRFDLFMDKIMKTIDEEDDKTVIEGVVGNINNLKVTWPENCVEVNGLLNFDMRNLNDFDFTIDLDVDYNSKKVDLAIGYTGKTFYLAFNDLLIKSSYNNTDDLKEKINHLFFNPKVPAEEGLGIKVDIDSIINSLIGGLDMGSLTTSLGLEIGEEVEVETNKIKCPLTIDLSTEEEQKDPIVIDLYFAKDSNELIGVNLTSLKFGDVEITGEITFEIISGHRVLGLDHEEYEGKKRCADGKEFIEIINYQSWFNDIFNLLNTKKLGLDFTLSIDQKDDGGVATIGDLAASMDVDASKFIIPIPKVINADTIFGSEEKEVKVVKSVETNDEGEENVISQVLDNLNFGLDLGVSKGDDHYADLNVTYAEQNAYLSLNNDVLKTKIDNQTINYMISEVTSLVEGLDKPANKKTRADGKEEQGLFDFVTSSELVIAITEGKYDGIIDVIKEISNSVNGINLVLDLSTLGFGENAEIALTLDATDNANKGVTGIKATDLEMGEGIFNLDLSTRNYKEETIQKVLNDKDNYGNLDFAVGVFDQVKSILDTKQTGFALEGSLLGNDGLGMSFAGDGQFDYGQKLGFGSINIYNHKTIDKPEQIDETHPIKVYVNNSSENVEDNDMKLVYGPNGKLKGKLSVSSLDDILNLVLKLVKKNDPRFKKFIDPILKMVYESVIGKIISSKDYLQLAKASFIKSIKQGLNGSYLDIDLSKDLFAGFLTEDLKIKLNFDSSSGVKKLASLQIVNLTLNETLGNKIVNCTISLKDFNAEAPLPLNPNDTYMNFSSLATLVEFGLDSTELNTYHLSADVEMKTILNITVQLSLDFWIEVLDEDTRVYGRFNDVPYVPVASNDMFTDVKSEFLFEPSKHYDPSSDDSIGGYFHILRNEQHKSIFNRDFEQYYYRATSDGFLDDILGFLLGGCLDFSSTVLNSFGNLSLDKGDNKPFYEEMFTGKGFEDKSVPENNKYEWDISMSLAKLTGISALDSLDAQIYGSKTTNSAGEEKSYLNALKAKLHIAITNLIGIDLNATINLVDIDPDAEGWATDEIDIHNRFEKIVSIYNTLSGSAKDEFDSVYMNHSSEEYAVQIDSSMPF